MSCVGYVPSPPAGSKSSVLPETVKGESLSSQRKVEEVLQAWSLPSSRAQRSRVGRAGASSARRAQAIVPLNMVHACLHGHSTHTTRYSVSVRPCHLVRASPEPAPPARRTSRGSLRCSSIQHALTVGQPDQQRAPPVRRTQSTQSETSCGRLLAMLAARAPRTYRTHVHLLLLVRIDVRPQRHAYFRLKEPLLWMA